MLRAQQSHRSIPIQMLRKIDEGSDGAYCAIENIIVFTWHDAGDWFGSYGYDNVDTPNCDRLAREGVRFAQHYSACAICSPSRAAIMTGRHCQNNGVMTLTNTPFINRIRPDTPHLAWRMKHELGYRTALFGVQHEAAHEHVPAIMDFDSFHVTDPWPSSDLTRPQVKKWLEDMAESDQPFYAQVGTFDAHLNRFYHNPTEVSDSEPYPPVQYTKKGVYIPPYMVDNQAAQESVATLQGLLQRGDRLMGTILDTLETTGLAENTIVCMCVDHGVGLPRAKTTCYDPGSKVAWFLRWPKELKAGLVVEALCTHVDVFPTLWTLLGQELPEVLDGHSLANHARGKCQAEVREETTCFMVENTRSLRTRHHKIIRNFRPSSSSGHRGDARQLHRGFEKPEGPTPPSDGRPNVQWPMVELYDLQTDPNEMKNLAFDEEHAEVLRYMDDRLWSFLHTYHDFILCEPVRTPWQKETYEQYAKWCEVSGHEVPQARGPMGNEVDAATSRGECV